MPGHLFECNTEDEVTTRRGPDILFASSGKSLRFQIQLDKSLTTHEQLEKQAEFRASTQDEA